MSFSPHQHAGTRIIITAGGRHTLEAPSGGRKQIMSKGSGVTWCQTSEPPELGDPRTVLYKCSRELVSRLESSFQTHTQPRVLVASRPLPAFTFRKPFLREPPEDTRQESKGRNKHNEGDEMRSKKRDPKPKKRRGISRATVTARPKTPAVPVASRGGLWSWVRDCPD